MTHKITREYEKKMSEISPFELKNILIDLADESGLGERTEVQKEKTDGSG